ncbi:MAG: hypothetical protein K2G55_10060 [Lachnospiraceae bacterium]|nr:hypothetical protein [Lachnospiraceae bacterium]MDE7203580.1 hypothetical protein [Lachnospiraceae bacterium]
MNTSEKLKELYDSEYGRYYNFAVTPLLEMGVKEQNIAILDYFDRNVEKALDKIAKSDVIYFTGGRRIRWWNVLLTMELWKH